MRPKGLKVLENMKFKLGDFVRFVDEKREGYVTKVIDAQTLGVTDSDGFEIPVAVNNLTHVHGHGIANSVEDEAPKPIAVNIPLPEKVDQGIYLLAAADDKVGNVVHFYLLNQTNNILLTSITSNRKEKYSSIFSGAVESSKKVSVHALNLSELDLWPELNFQIILHQKGNEKPLPPLDIVKKFRAKDFSGEKKELPNTKLKGWVFRLDEKAPLIDAQKLKDSFFKVKVQEQKMVPIPAKEIDLHIEKLRDDHHFLEAAEIFKIQMDYFQNALDAAIVHHFDKITFIHGTGNGSLRDKIHKIISQNAHVKTYMDAQKEKFGYGATEIVFK